MRLLGVAVAASMLALAGCQSKPIEQMSYTEVQQLSGVIAKRCHDQGVRSPSRQFDACIQQEITREQSTRADNYRRRMAAAEALGDLGDSYSRGANAATYRPPVNCTSRLAGTNVGQPTRIDTTCY